jgi:hypothetical protein
MDAFAEHETATGDLSDLTRFSHDYSKPAIAFGQRARRHETINSLPIDAPESDIEYLTIDVAVSAPSTTALVLSSGLHGVEGLFGSAVQAAARIGSCRTGIRRTTRQSSCCMP